MLGIVIITYNITPDVFILQTEAIKKFCKDEYVVEVFDNSSDNNLSEGIKYHALRLGCEYTRTKASSVNSSDSHAWAANFAIDKIKKKYLRFLFLDHDCIPVKPFSVTDILWTKIMAGLGQGSPKTKTYFWPGCVMWKLVSDMVDFSPNTEHGLDTGGNLYKVVEKYTEENCVFFNEEYHQNPHYKGRYNTYAMINNGMFMHFINTSNWNKEKNNAERLNSLINIARSKAGL